MVTGKSFEESESGGSGVGIHEAIEGADLVVVGAGFFGATTAERAATILGKRVVVLDRRAHIGGNAWSEVYPGTDIEVHKYGSHIFHTSNARVWEYINKFTEFNDYRHRVIAVRAGVPYPLPISLATICQFLGRMMSPAEAAEWVQAQTVGLESGENLEQRAISLIGRPLYEAFIRGYTAKQWQTDPAHLPPEIIQRLPVRMNFNTRYFADRYEGIPAQGYGKIFTRMLDHPGISVHLGVDFADVRSLISRDQLLVYTGAIDQYFDFIEGPMGWRTVDLEFEIHAERDFQGTSVVNYADVEIPFTRIHEFKHFHPERAVFGDQQTVIAREFSRFASKQDDPYYPIGGVDDRQRLTEYRKRAQARPNVIFGGRLGSYQYLDMHMAIASALSVFDNDIVPRLSDPGSIRHPISGRQR